MLHGKKKEGYMFSNVFDVKLSYKEDEEGLRQVDLNFNDGNNGIQVGDSFTCQPEQFETELNKSIVAMLKDYSLKMKALEEEEKEEEEEIDENAEYYAILKNTISNLQKENLELKKEIQKAEQSCSFHIQQTSEFQNTD